uniref:Uncharacterized protein n=1 Tax=Trypanosoma congolense (strain IL3000) TaxID=1068625 RepID=G0UXW9_TRYCI|nr:conserved hypothetical protein [Trypanosoma congolense IL3000]
MKKYIRHKESLPAQVGIKRRRVAAPEVAPNAVGDSVAGKDKDGSIERAECEKEIGNSKVTSAPEDKTPSLSECSEDESFSDEDDEEELKRERRRVEELKQKKKLLAEGNNGQRTTAKFSSADGPSNVSANNKRDHLGGISSYNCDVLFRCSQWRTSKTSTGDNGDKKKKAKWEAVTNDTQSSAAYKHFMKHYFK